MFYLGRYPSRLLVVRRTVHLINRFFFAESCKQVTWGVTSTRHLLLLNWYVACDIFISFLLWLLLLIWHFVLLHRNQESCGLFNFHLLVLRPAVLYQAWPGSKVCSSRLRPTGLGCSDCGVAVVCLFWLGMLYICCMTVVLAWTVTGIQSFYMVNTTLPGNWTVGISFLDLVVFVPFLSFSSGRQ